MAQSCRQRFRSLDRKGKCRVVSVVLTLFLGIVGVTCFIYGGLRLYRVSLHRANEDGTSNLLLPFIKCTDIATYSTADRFNSSVDESAVYNALKRQCLSAQLPARFSVGVAGFFVILALFVAPCAFKRDNWVGFGIFTATGIALTMMALVVVGSQAAGPASSFVDCRHLSSATIAELGKRGLMCIRSSSSSEVIVKKSALRWFCKLHTFYGGAAASVLALLLLLVIRCCRCCRCNKAEAGCGASPQMSVQAETPEGLPISAPTYYAVPTSAASEDAGAEYYRANQ
jgi:hypothetical protein